jgi:hypothetical protein
MVFSSSGQMLGLCSAMSRGQRQGVLGSVNEVYGMRHGQLLQPSLLHRVAHEGHIPAEKGQ